MGEAGRRIVLEEFDEEIVIGRTLEIYQALSHGMGVPARSTTKGDLQG
jgi:hypothetical protein